MVELELIMAAYDMRDALIKYVGAKPGAPAVVSDLGKIPWGKAAQINNDGAIADLQAKLAVRLDLANLDLEPVELDRRIRIKLAANLTVNRWRYYWVLPEYATNTLVSKANELYPGLRVVRRRKPQRTDEEYDLYQTVRLALDNVLGPPRTRTP